MQSHGETMRKYGHSRRPSYGKAMPVSALLMNFSSSQHRSNDSIARDEVSSTGEHDEPPMLFTLAEVNSHHDCQGFDPNVESKNLIESEQIDCSSVSAENEFVFVSLKDVSLKDASLPSNNDIETCPMTELCNLLCDNSCKKIEKPFADNDNVKARANDNRQKFLSSMMAEDNVTPAAEPGTKNVEVFSDEKLTNDYIDKLKISEALVRTSMLTSPAARRRLAARKIEMELDAASENADDNEYVPPRELLMFLVRYTEHAPKIF